MMMARRGWMISPKGSGREQNKSQWAALNHCGHRILVIEYIISSSGLTGSCINGRDVCDKLSLSINTVNLDYGESWTCASIDKANIGRGCGE